MTAYATLAHWHSIARASAKAENMLRLPTGALYCFAPFATLQNGAITGRIFHFEHGYGLRDIGAFKIASDGSVPLMVEPLRATLTAAPEAPRATEPPTVDEAITQ